jgi:esterase/lipase superfamily enzyme
MSPFQLRIALAPNGALSCRWFGQSARRPDGTLTLPLAPQAGEANLPARFAIDLAPLLAEVANGLIPDAEALAAADDLLALRDLLDETAQAELYEALFLFLWRAARTAPPLTARRGADGSAWADPDRRLVRVWFATNRARSAIAEPGSASDAPGDDGAELADRGAHPFSDSASAEGLSFGRCSVFIPESHRPGSVGSPWWRRWIRLEADDRLQLRATRPLPEPRFWDWLAECLTRDWQPGERNLFVLIHGFNVGFADAAVRAAQIGYDLKVPGEMAFYSWPSRGGVLDYWADEATITASVAPLAEFLDGLRTRSGAERIHLFVHSMGNRGFLSALERLAARSLAPLRLGQVFFCAPDEDVRTFADKTRLFPQECENRTLLVSPDDKAVALSRWKHQYDRVGIVPPLHPYDGIETVAVTGFGLLDLGHGYFAEAEPVILDLREAIASRRRAAERAVPRAEEGHFVIDLRQ